MIMYLFIASILIISVAWLGGVNYWTICLVNTLSLIAILVYLIQGLRKHVLEYKLSAFYIPFICIILLIATYLFTSDVYFYARKQFLLITTLILVFVITYNYIKSAEKVRLLLYVIMGISLMLALYGICQYYFFPDKTYMILKPFEYRARASGTFISPNLYGDYLAMSLPVILCYLLYRVKMVSSGQNRWADYIKALALSIIAAVVFVGMLLSFSRGCYVAFFIGYGLCAFLLIRKKYAHSGMVVILGLVFFMSMYMVNLSSARGGQEKVTAGDKARIVNMHDTITMCKDAPLIGHGMGAYRWKYAKFKHSSICRVVQYAHNAYLHIAAETGVIGLIIIALLIWLIFKQCLAVSRSSLVTDEPCMIVMGLGAGIVVGLVHGCVDFNFLILANAMLMVVFGGIISSLYSEAYPQKTKTYDLKKIRSQLVIVGIIGVIVFMIINNGRILTSSQYYFKGDKYAKALEWTKALTCFHRGYDIDTANPILAGKIADIYYKKYIFSRDERELFREKALMWYNKALLLNPYDGFKRVRLASLKQDAHDNIGAISEVERALLDDPNNWYFYRVRGLLLYKQKEYFKAVSAFKRAVDIYPRDMVSKDMIDRIRRDRMHEGK